MRRINSIIIMCIKLMVVITSTAIPAPDMFNHHVIVLIDRSGGMRLTQVMNDQRKLDERKESILASIKYDLPKICCQEGSIIPGRKLVDETKNDYLSIVSFGLLQDHPDFLKFIETALEDGQEYGCEYQQDFDESIFEDLANFVDENYHTFFRKHLTVLSVAMPLAIYHLRRTQNNRPLVNKTYLVWITDEEYNISGDPVLELMEIKKEEEKGVIQKIANFDSALSRYEKVQSSFTWHRVPEDQPVEKWRGDIVIKVFEFTPLAKVFALESTLQYDNQKIYFYRVPGGYQSNFKIVAHNDSMFSVIKLRLTLHDNAGNIIRQDSLENLAGTEYLHFDLGNHYFKRDLTLQLMAWVNSKDNAYGIHVLHPDGSELQGARGLIRTLPAQFEERLRIWGMIPIWNELFNFTTDFWFDGQKSVKIFWDFFLGLIFLLVVIAIVQLRATVTNRNMDRSKLVTGEYK